jgi:hypothetical protein
MAQRRWIDLIPEGYDFVDVLLMILIFGLILVGCLMAVIDHYCKVCG